MIIDSIISYVSIPVVPITPGDIAETQEKPSDKASIKYRCLVTIVLSITYGPIASGVTLLFPRPTTKAFFQLNVILLTYLSIQLLMYVQYPLMF